MCFTKIQDYHLMNVVFRVSVKKVNVMKNNLKAVMYNVCVSTTHKRMSCKEYASNCFLHRVEHYSNNTFSV